MENVKFTVSVYMKEHEEKHTKWVPDIIGYTTEQEEKEIGCGGMPIYSTTSGSYKPVIEKIPGKTLKTYEQIPLIYENTNFSLIVDPNSLEIISAAEGLISNMTLYCDPKYCELQYGFEYLKGGKIIKKSFNSQEYRNRNCLEETGYDFSKLDYSDKLSMIRMSGNPSISTPKQKGKK